MADPDFPPAADPRSQSFARRWGRLCAAVRITPGQTAFFLGFSALVALALVRHPEAVRHQAGAVLALVAGAALGLKLAALLARGLGDPALRPELSRADSSTLPRITILVPLFREAAVVPDMLFHLARLEYPTDRLQVLLLLEPDDDETLAAVAAQALPEHMTTVLSPPGPPRTKPRACNEGLAQATGELLVIYDAEDRPEPDQLRKAAAAFADAPPDLACLQCRLDHYNSRQSMAAAWATVDYLFWFRLLLPGLVKLGAPIPLGGTSNIFRIEVLRKLDGWDPFNVTEDADLGLRLARHGYRTAMLDSTTWEEAVTTLPAWVRQRSRWVKGFWQTWLVHCRRGLPGSFGLWRFLLMTLHLGGTVAVLLLNPVAWVILLAWLAIGWSIVDIRDPVSIAALIASGVLLAANVLFVALNLAGCLHAGRRDLILPALLSPLAWILHSVAAWKGVWQWIGAPFRWEKTAHGLADTPRPARRLGGVLTAVGLVVLALAALVGMTVGATRRLSDDIAAQAPRPPILPVQLPLVFTDQADRAVKDLGQFFSADLATWSQGLPADAPEPAAAGRFHRIVRHPGETVISCRRAVGDDVTLAACRGLACSIWLPEGAPAWSRVSIRLCDRDGLWFQLPVEQALLPGVWTQVEIDLLAGGWQPRGHILTWRPGYLHHIAQVDLVLHGHGSWQGPLAIAGLRSIHRNEAEQAAARAMRLTILDPGPATLPVWTRWQMDADLGKEYANPFDPDEVDLRCRIVRPDGVVDEVAGFWNRDFTRALIDGRERLTPTGRDRWSVRYAPRMAGPHRATLVARDRDGARATGSELRFEATAAPGRGYVQRSSDPAYLAFGDGSFFYPLGHNICQPVDLQQPYPYAFTVPPDQGTFTYDRFFTRMQEAGENWGRIWLTPWNLGLEGNPRWPPFHGVGHYNLQNAWKLDHLLDQAERHGLWLTLTTMHKSEYSRENWLTTAYNQALGGPLARSTDFFTDPGARTAYRKRLRYLVARTGWSPRVLCWELFGECNLMPGFKPTDSTAWHQEMARHLQAQDLGRHLVFTHCHNWQNGNDLWELPEISCVQGNGYIRPPNRTTDHVVNFLNYLDEVGRFQKPVFVAEYGGRSELGAPDEDYLEAQLHSGLWASLVMPFGGLAAQWWWNYVDGGDRYFHYRAVSRFCQGIDRLAHRYRPLAPCLTGPPLEVRGMQAADRGFYWVYHPEIFVRYRDLPTVDGARLTLADLPAGSYRVTFHDCHSGEAQERILALPGEIPLPRIRRDLAVKVEPAEGSDPDS